MKRRVLWLNVILASALALVLGGGYLLVFAQQPEATTGRIVPVQQGTVTESVTASGTVETAGRVELGFEASGLVTAVEVSVGDQVRAGQSLVAIDSQAAQQQVASATKSLVDATNSGRQQSAQLSAARAALAEAKADAKVNARGYDQAVEQARAALDAAVQSWGETCLDPSATCPNPSAWAALRAAEGDVQTAQRNYDQKVAIAHQGEISANLAVNQANVSLVTERANATGTCDTYGSTSTQCTSANSTLLKAQQAYDTALNNRTTTLMNNQQAVDNANASITDANVALRKLQADLMRSASDSSRSAQAAYDNAVLARTKGRQQDAQLVANAQEALAQLSAAAGSVSVGGDVVSAAEAAVGAAEASLAQASTTLDRASLESPIDGTILALDAEVDQMTGGSAGSPAVVIVPTGAYQVEAAFSEADAVKIAVGDKATVTFDALPGQTATGTVTAVDALATTASNLVTYTVTIAVQDAPEQVREGMTATIAVVIAEEADVLWVPSAALTKVAGQTTVTIRRDGVDTVTPVTTGLVGDKGTVITAGVKAGDQLVVNTAAAGSGFPTVGMPGVPGSGGGAGLGRMR